MTAQLQDRLVLSTLVSGLRSRLDAAIIRIADLESECSSLRTTLLGEAEVADAERELPERKGSAWWMSAWREVTRQRNEMLARVQTLEVWLKESGEEATRLQTELTDRIREIGELTRALDLARAGEQVIEDAPDDEVH